MSYTLTDTDRRIVESTVAGVLAEVPKIRAIHEERLAELRPQLAAMERAVAMRELALELLNTPPTTTTGSTP